MGPTAQLGKHLLTLGVKIILHRNGVQPFLQVTKHRSEVIQLDGVVLYGEPSSLLDGPVMSGQQLFGKPKRQWQGDVLRKWHRSDQKKRGHFAQVLWCLHVDCQLCVGNIAGRSVE